MRKACAPRFTAMLMTVVLGGALPGCSSCRDDATPSAPDAPSVDEGSGEGTGFTVWSNDGSEAPGTPSEPVAVLVDGEVVLTVEEQEARLADMVTRYEALPSQQQTTPAWRDERRARIAESAVEDFLMARYVASNRPDISDAAFQEHLRSTLGAVYENESMYARLLAQRNTTREAFEASERAVLAEDILLAQREAFEPTEDEIIAFYERNRERFVDGDRVLVRTITVRLRRTATPEEEADALSRITALRERIVQGGEAFGDVARSESESLDRMNDGMMGWLVRGRRVELAANGVEDRLFALPEGEVSEVLRTDLGYQIFVVEGRREAGVRELDEVRETIAEPVRRNARQRLRREVINELRTSANVILVQDEWRTESDAAAP